MQGTSGCEFHADLSVPSRAMVVRKGYNVEVDSYSAFFENDGSSIPRLLSVPQGGEGAAAASSVSRTIFA